MYKVARLMGTGLVVFTLVCLIVLAVSSGSWLIGTPLVLAAVGLGIFSTDIVEFFINIVLGLPTEPRRK